MKTQSIHLEAGQELVFDFKFSTDDYLPFNDFSFFAVDEIDNAVTLADVAGGATAWSAYDFVAPSSGEYHFGFGVMNVGDEGVNSSLYIDNVRLVS